MQQSPKCSAVQKPKQAVVAPLDTCSLSPRPLLLTVMEGGRQPSSQSRLVPWNDSTLNCGPMKAQLARAPSLPCVAAQKTFPRPPSENSVHEAPGSLKPLCAQTSLQVHSSLRTSHTLTQGPRTSIKVGTNTPFVQSWGRDGLSRIQLQRSRGILHSGAQSGGGRQPPCEDDFTPRPPPALPAASSPFCSALAPCYSRRAEEGQPGPSSPGLLLLGCSLACAGLRRPQLGGRLTSSVRPGRGQALERGFWLENSVAAAATVATRMGMLTVPELGPPAQDLVGAVLPTAARHAGGRVIDLKPARRVGGKGWLQGADSPAQELSQQPHS